MTKDFVPPPPDVPRPSGPIGIEEAGNGKTKKKCGTCEFSHETDEAYPMFTIDPDGCFAAAGSVIHVLCTRYPKWVSVDEEHYCGEHTEGE